ncbi:MAG: PSD1 and planctomycete cytochrome C domain-containing protein, partial [Planctomycetota bacterium]|nr:PSD1 and planctomycete cytochrome C domain-containing protein [Planctomycetota bacterium]
MKHRSVLAIAFSVFSIAAFVEGADNVDFNRDVRPILSDLCFTCHGPDANTREAELRLDQESAVFAKRDTPLVVPGKPLESELIRRILSNDDDLRMPPPESKKQLTDAQKVVLQKWVEQGAKWAIHWAYVPPARVAPPAVKHHDAVLNDVDRFILQRVKAAGLAPSKHADEPTLVRRLFFDLIGLPPKLEDVDAYVTSNDPQKYEKLVDRLLSSKHFGERLAIYWLDVVRYADSNGYHSDEARQSAPYRDYVINAFNSNKPYDQFVVEQLAGDLLPEAGIEQQVASGFNMLLQTTSEGGAQAKEYLAKYMADRVRNTSQIFLGSTMGCCECHDHKYDPFTMKDFYSFGSFFADISEIAVGNPRTYPVIDDAAQQKLADFDFQLAAANGELNKTTPELSAAQAKWEATTLADLETAAAFSPWQMLGPFKAASFDEAWSKDFGPEAKVDLKQAFGKVKWTKQDKLKDGAAYPLSGENSSWYFHRTATVSSEIETELSLGSDDAIAVWINGKQVHANKVQRGVAPDQDKVKVQLAKGDNEILIKVVNAAGAGGFYFNAKAIGVPANVVAALKVAAESRNDSQKNEVANYFRTVASELKSVRDEIARLNNEKAAYEKSIPRTLMTKSVNPRPIRLLPRGNWLDETGPVMTSAIPEFLGNIPKEGRADRLDLAKWIVSRDNPLTARTFVNRLWKLYFGSGLATPLDDLGRQGTLPTHPELLDWLAVEFMDSDWNVKQMIRLLVTSGTYRQSSVASSELRKLDPYNQLYARQSRFRIEAEMVRDNALAISGLLVEKVGGRSTYPYQPAGYWRHMNFPARKWPGDKGEELYRRGLYTWWQRMFLHPSMVAFDAPSREECTVERPRSNIPQQALVLLNDP